MKDADLKRDFRRVAQKNGLTGTEEEFKVFKLGVRYGFAMPDPEDDLLDRMVQAASEIED